MKETIRIIKGIRYRCRDLGCDDLERAAQNRLMVANQEHTTAYRMVEDYLTHTPQNKPLPSWIPLGELPDVDRRDWREHGGGREELLQKEKEVSVVET